MFSTAHLLRLASVHSQQPADFFMATPSAFNRPYATNAYDRSKLSEFEKLQQMPFGADNLANRAATPVGRSTMDPARIAGMISRGTARPGQIEAAKFAGAMAGQAEALEGAKAQREYYQNRAQAEKLGASALVNAYRKMFGENKATTPTTNEAAKTEQAPPTEPATGQGVPMLPSAVTPPTLDSPSPSSQPQNISSKLNPYGFGATGINLGTPSVVPLPEVPKKKPAQSFANQFNPYGLGSAGLTF